MRCGHKDDLFHERERLEDQAQALRDSVRLSDLRYRAGQSSYLDLLNAQQQLFAAELLVERALLEELLSSVRLYKALGGGVQIEPGKELALGRH